VQVARRRDLILLEEAAQVDGSHLLVVVAALVVQRIGLELLLEAQLGGQATVVVVVRVRAQAGGPSLRVGAQAEEDVEQAVERLDVVGLLDQRGPQGVADHVAPAEPDVRERAQAVDAFGRRHAHVMAAQHLQEVVEDPVHRSWPI